MSEAKGSAAKTLFVAIVVVAVIAGIYVLNMAKFNGLLGIGDKTASTTMAPAATGGNMVTGGASPTADSPQPAAQPAADSTSPAAATTPAPDAATSSTATAAPTGTTTATPPAPPAEDKKVDDKKPEDKKASGKKSSAKKQVG